MVGILKRATGTSGLPNQFDTGPDWDWLSSVGGQYAQSNNPGSRRARLAGAVYRHLDPGTGDFVTTVLRRFTCHAPACVWALCGVGTETFCLRYLTDSMSALGHKRTFRVGIAMSALPPKADIGPCAPRAKRHVRIPVVR
jgi:hypothetical protein